MDCEHRKIKKNYPFGKKSTPSMHCKDCGKIITLKHLEKIRIAKAKKQRNRKW